MIIDAQHWQMVADFMGKHLHLPGAHLIELDERLGLALVGVPGVADCAAGISAAQPKVVEALTESAAGDPIDLLDPIDIVLGELRAQLARAFGGWSPDMDKNRQVANVVTWPGTKGAANEPKVPNGPATWQQVLLEALPGGVADPAAGRDVKIGILDTQMFAHPNLAGAYLSAEQGLLQAGTTLSAGNGHATFVAGLVHAHAPAAILITDFFLNQNESSALTWDVAKKLVSFVGRGFDMVNFSFGSRTGDGKAPFAMRRAIEKLSADTLVIAAAGNHGETDHAKAPMWPAALPGVIAVGATDGKGHRASFSPDLPWVRCAAPAINVLSTYLSGEVIQYSEEHVKFPGFARWSGTSFAAAKVTGMVAARTVPGVVSAKDAFNLLLAETDPVVKPYEWRQNP
ncbi:S8 family peptidase [Amycolatopsis tolypomycina]|uniref:S8 family peptidase n=1 Tax=Amycolatopsis tolypomycina TaxID=208445 RepID=UPI00142E642A|nr:S8/S53 family peptidase [Amycolatopsis tolypomycina]